MDVTGTLKVKGETVKVSEKFTKREFVITDNSSSQYPQHISFQLAQDKCGLLDPFQLGSEIKVHFNLRGREWTSPQGELKHFNSLEAWRLESVNAGSNNTSATTPSSAGSISEPMSETFTATSKDDDLPF